MRPSSVTPLLPIAQRGLPFTSEDGRAFFRLAVPWGGYISFPVRSRAFREWFYHQFYVEYESVPTAHAFSAILKHLEAEASQGEHHHYIVSRRVGSRGGAYIPRQ